MAEEFKSFLKSTRKYTPPPPGIRPGGLPIKSERMFGSTPKRLSWSSIRTPGGTLEERRFKSGLEMMEMAKELREYFERFEPKTIEINKVIVECSYCGSVGEEGICNYCGI